MPREIYGDDVNGIDDLERWLEHRAVQGIYREDDPLIGFNRRGNRVYVRFVSGDALNTPAMLVKAIQDTPMYLNHLKLGWSRRHSIPAGEASATIVDPTYEGGE